VAFLAVLGSHGSNGAALAYTLSALVAGSIWLFLARRLLLRAPASGERAPVLGKAEATRQ
jgi:hypothetical protein